MLEEATELYVKLRRSPKKFMLEWGSNYKLQTYLPPNLGICFIGI